ncbi:MAG: PF20097 family protein [Bacillota bacterium]|nr:PF20097 family protein [Bacillota bacterium]
MKCPYCQNDMEKGFIQCRDGVTWTPKKQWAAALSSLGKGSVSLENGTGNNRTVFAYRCAACRKVIIEYTE